MKIYMFDVDGTITESRMVMDDDMVSLLYKLLENNKVAIISGGNLEQINKQVPIKHKNLILFPVCAAKMYIDNNLVYCNEIEDRKTVIDAIKIATYGVDVDWNNNVIDDRICQITFSALGKDAPTELKRFWDPQKTKRKIIAERLRQLLPDFEITIGGLSSIDITNKGVDKSYAVYKLIEMGYDKNDMLFIGDAMFEGGNDYPVIKTGIKCIMVDSVSSTKKIISELLNE